MKRRCLYLLALATALAACSLQACAQSPVNDKFKVENQGCDQHDAIIYPNPAVRGSKINVKTSQPIKNVEITNRIGNTIFMAENEYLIHDDLELDLHTSTPGVYYARITFEDDKTVVKKLIMR